jgi:hypothetical protein
MPDMDKECLMFDSWHSIRLAMNGLGVGVLLAVQHTVLAATIDTKYFLYRSYS